MGQMALQITAIVSFSILVNKIFFYTWIDNKNNMDGKVKNDKNN